jgi:type III restriction enzyme
MRQWLGFRSHRFRSALGVCRLQTLIFRIRLRAETCDVLCSRGCVSVIRGNLRSVAVRVNPIGGKFKLAMSKVPTDRTIENPIINSPFSAPSRHFRFDDDGITNEIVELRRRSAYFVPIPASKKKGQAQPDLFNLTEERVEENVLINDIRGRVDQWREMGYPSTTAVTRKLLVHWNSTDRLRPLFFCQREAVETAIFLAESAGKMGHRHYENQIREANNEANPGLYRLAFKMATGTGKTAVMAMVIAWHTLNKVADPQNKLFSDSFLVVCPGITIRDRLRVLLPSDPENYYRALEIVPPEDMSKMGQAKVVVTNFHSFKLRERIAAPATTKKVLLPKGDVAGVFQETPDQMVRRVCREFGNKKNIVVLNDEAHHCYRRRPGIQNEGVDVLKGEEKKEAKTREEEARIWINGVEAIQAKLGVRAVYDLSATPFFLSGSGWAEGTIFPWAVSDFSLIDAIESGLVKIPRVPIADDAEAKDTLYRNLWIHIRDDLPKQGRDSGDGQVEPRLPPLLQTALHSLYSDYEKRFQDWKGKTSDFNETPPVFIVVCNNTRVSKLVFDYIAGWEKTTELGQVVVPGALEHFSNEVGGKWRSRMQSILIDSSQLESGESMKDEFKKIASREIEDFKREYELRFPGRDSSKLTDEDLLREVMNTVGKRGKLGENIRCVVSVSMLTEGWDANTVTHILGVRAFTTQLLCEQVVGRGLRRRSYALDEETGHFVPEYAEVYGIPFSFIPARDANKPTPSPKPVRRVFAVPDRGALEITFPRVTGYKWEIPEENLDASFGPDSAVVLSAKDVPTRTDVSGVVGEQGVHTLDDLMRVRPQQLAFKLAKGLLDKYFRGDDGLGNQTAEKPWLYPRLLEITKTWINDPSCLVLKDNTFVGLLYLDHNAAIAVEKIYRGIVRSKGADKNLRPILRSFEPIGSTSFIDFDTSKPVWETAPNKCHVNLVAADTDSWEQRMAQALEEVEEVICYVKNQGMGFTIPYTVAGMAHQYFPDFIALVDDGRGRDDALHLIVEVSGQRDLAKEAKVATCRDLWVPSVNNYGQFGRWDVVEVTDPWDAHEVIRSFAAGRVESERPV